MYGFGLVPQTTLGFKHKPDFSKTRLRDTKALKAGTLPVMVLPPSILRCLCVAACLQWAVSAHAADRVATPSAEVQECLLAVAQKHDLAPVLLFAIAEHESSYNPNAVNVTNANGSVDYGLVQINSAWLPTLARYGIARDDLFTPCINADVGGWILASNFKRGVSWDAVGAYNAQSPNKRFIYATAIYKKVQRLLRLQGITPDQVRIDASAAPFLETSYEHNIITGQ